LLLSCFKEPLKYSEQNISTLSKKYKVYFFVLQYQHHRNSEISLAEIKTLKQYGNVYIYNSQNSEADEMAEALTNYIETIVRQRSIFEILTKSL